MLTNIKSLRLKIVEKLVASTNSKSKCSTILKGFEVEFPPMTCIQNKVSEMLDISNFTVATSVNLFWKVMIKKTITPMKTNITLKRIPNFLLIQLWLEHWQSVKFTFGLA